MDRYAVVGNPVTHSLSPRIHRAFAEATGQTLRYGTLLAPLDAFEETVAAFFAEGGAGLNVTVPFKERAAAWVDELSADAAAAGAVNTIVREHAGFRGCNTDGAGLVQDILGNCGEALSGQRVLLLGAGGAARGAVRPLLAQGLQQLVIANRTADRAEAMARELAGEHCMQGLHAVQGLGLARVTGAFDVVINATSAGLSSGGVAAVDPAVVRDAFCYDMIYGPLGQGPSAATDFCRWAREHGARRVVDGLGMLVEQAALAFALWRGVTPPTAAVLELLRRGDVS